MQLTIDGWLGFDTDIELKNTQPKCRINDWRRENSVEFLMLNKGERKMKFDFIIGNPPYQDETLGENKRFAPPIYHKFMDGAYQVSDRVELIHPARFLFNAGSTPKDWNKNMLQDEHFKVLFYEADSSKVFPNTDIKGGVSITYRDNKRNFGSIDHFVIFNELRSIQDKVSQTVPESFSTIISAAESYRFTTALHDDIPNAENMLSKGHKFDLKTSVLENLGGLAFFDSKPTDNREYVRIYGLIKGVRVTRWIRKDYIKAPKNFEKFKVFVPKANGSGALGEVLSTPVIGHTQSFISVGSFDSEQEANCCLKYIKSKFCRVMLGILKITQDNPAPKWRYVPLQDFTAASDIDWSKSIPEIDKQLYAKYGLDEKEIAFIESHVKEMA